MADETTDEKQPHTTIDSQHIANHSEALILQSIAGSSSKPPITIENNTQVLSAKSHDDLQLIIAQGSNAHPRRIYWPNRTQFLTAADNVDDDDDGEQGLKESLIDHAWSKRILKLVGNKLKLMESFSWLSTVGGGYSALGESDQKFSSRAGALSLGQQLELAELLGDERLRVMCHLFAALAALQMNNKPFCLNYIKRVILPLMHAMPYRDPQLTNILKHICFRISTLERFVGARRQGAIRFTKRSNDSQL